MITIKEPVEFEWDYGNHEKNWIKHQVDVNEAEEVFFSQDRKIAKDFFHSKNEDRYIILGETKKGRKLYIVFTIRNGSIRIISARDLNKREYGLWRTK